MIPELVQQLQQGNRKALARCISLIENEADGYESLLSSVNINRSVPVIGITGPPGSGKSSLLNVIIQHLLIQNDHLQIAVLAVDPTSPFTKGSLLGDRLRMTSHFNDERVYIRSIATRGALGGLAAKTVEITDLLRSAGFHYVFIETVGVGQSEVEIASLADTTVVVLVPEAGDEIQALKAGIMEIADVFVINKSDRDGADKMMKNLQSALHEKPFTEWLIPVLKTVALSGDGVLELIEAIKLHQQQRSAENKISTLAEQAYRIIQNQRMQNLSIKQLNTDLMDEIKKGDFNIYAFVKKYKI